MAKRTDRSNEPSEKLLTLEEAAAFLGTSKPTLYRLLDQNRLKGRKVGNQWRFLQADLQAYLDRGSDATVLPPVPKELLDPEWDFLAGELKKLGKTPMSLDGEGLDDHEKRIAAMVGAVMTMGVTLRASDIHLESVHEQGQVQALLRLRIDGVLKEIRRLPMAVATAMAACLKRYMHMDPEIRRPQDGRMLVRADDREVDFRASILPTIFGESVVLRILDRQGIVLGLDHLGLTATDKGRLRDWGRSHGLLIFTGPTGCGKTTLIYSLLQEIARSQVKTLTIEDPVELAMPWATQLQINAAQGVTFAPALRSVMRQDPDVIFVGEIRDQETMLGCVQAALTGHLVLTTLHAPDAIKAVFRMRDMGIEPFLIASALVGVAAERLVRKVCPDCGESAPLANGSRAKVTAQAATGGFSLPAKARFQKGKGCKTCFGSGYRGRTGVFELLEFTPALKDAFLKGTDEPGMRQVAVREGMPSLTGDGIRKATEGITSIEEILRVFSAD